VRRLSIDEIDKINDLVRRPECTIDRAAALATYSACRNPYTTAGRRTRRDERRHRAWHRSGLLGGIFAFPDRSVCGDKLIALARPRPHRHHGRAATIPWQSFASDLLRRLAPVNVSPARSGTRLNISTGKNLCWAPPRFRQAMSVDSQSVASGCRVRAASCQNRRHGTRA